MDLNRQRQTDKNIEGSKVAFYLRLEMCAPEFDTGVDVASASLGAYVECDILLNTSIYVGGQRHSATSASTSKFHTRKCAFMYRCAPTSMLSVQ